MALFNIYWVEEGYPTLCYLTELQPDEQQTFMDSVFEIYNKH